MVKDKTLFTSILGENSTIKVLEFLLENKYLDFGATDIATGSLVSNQMVYIVIKKLEKNDIVIKTRQLKGKQFYKLNEKNKITKKLNELFVQILK